jgi:prepilin-type N-terminal cleavage/methylation domain-containing protein
MRREEPLRRTDGPRSAHPRDRSSVVLEEAGFTLVEAMIALIISGILASALISLLLGQSRFYERTDDQIYAEQSLRASMDLVATELRMGGSADLLSAEADSITLRFDLMRAIVCDTTGADAVTAFAFDRITDANVAGGATGTAVSGPYVEPFTYADGWLPTESATGSGPKTSCVATGAPAGLPDPAYATLTGWLSGIGARPDPGSVVRFYGTLQYRFAPSTFFATRTALWRGSQELIGPFDNGATFSYLMADGSVQTSVASADLADVRGVRLTATALGDGANRFNVQRPIELDVPFRN